LGLEGSRRGRHAAQAQAEGQMIGVKEMDEAATHSTVSSISERTKEIAALIR
jgi:hypothetical protein